MKDTSIRKFMNVNEDVCNEIYIEMIEKNYK